MANAAATLGLSMYVTAGGTTDALAPNALVIPAPAIAISSSRSALAAPLTPMAPITWTSSIRGMPPWSGVKSLRATIAVRPPLMISSKAFVGFLKTAAVRALPIAM